MTYLKIGAIVALVIGLFGFGWYGGALSGKAAVARLQRNQAQLTATAVLAERASTEAQTKIDTAAQVTHAQDIAQIDDVAPIATPLLVYRSSPTPSCPVSGATAQAGSLPADPDGGPSQPVDRGRAVDVRPQIEALKHRLEIIMADYRQQDREWPKP